MKPILILLATLCFSFSTLLAQDGSPDLSFGLSGIGRADSVYAAVGYMGSTIQRDGKILVITDYTWHDSASNMFVDAGFRVKRFLRNGLIDSTFNRNCRIQVVPGWLTDGVCEIKLQSTGRILLTNNKTIIALDSNGKIDSAFGKKGRVDGIGNSVVLPDDKIFLVGPFSTGRLQASGKVDSTYGIAGLLPYKQPYSIWSMKGLSITPDKKFIICAYSTDFNSALIQFTSFGQLDSSFGKNGYLIPQMFDSGNVTYPDYHFDQSGNLLLSAVRVSGNQAAASIFRYFSNGSVDSSFANNGQLLVDSFTVVSQSVINFVTSFMNIQSDGRLIHAFNSPDSSSIIIRRFGSNGTIDPSFGAKGKTTLHFGDFDTPGGLLLQSDSKILLVACSDFAASPFIANRKTVYVARLNNSLHLGVLNFPSGHLQANIYPNPIEKSATLTYELTSDASISINLLDMSGKTVQHFLTNRQQKGSHSSTLYFRTDIVPGNYILSISNGCGTESVRISKL